MIIITYQTMRGVFGAGEPTANDGFEEWPVANVRAGGFDDGFTGIDQPITEFPITVSVNGLANGAEAHDLYISQRTDEPTKQYLSAVRTDGKSGSWDISLTAKCVSDLGLVGPTDTLNETQLRLILKHVYLYVQRHSDAAIQYVSLLDTTLMDP